MTTTERSDPRSVLARAAGHGAVRSDIPDAEHEVHDVLLIHGQPGSSLVWTRVSSLLRSRGLRVLAIDRPGYGHTGGKAEGQFGNATAIAQILDDRWNPPAVVVGHSHGAGIALALTATAPHHVRALVLVAPAAGPGAVTATDRVLAVPIIGLALTWLGFRTAGLALHIPVLHKRILTDRFGLNGADANEVVRRVTHGEVWRSFTTEQRHLASDSHLLQARLGEIRCPIVIVEARRDRIVRPRVVAEMARQLPHAKIITTDTGHLIPIDDPDAVVDAVLCTLRPEYRKHAPLISDPQTRSC